MIEFKKLHIQNFKSIYDIELDFDSLDNTLYSLKGINNTTNFSSSNGAGKSTIFDCISFVLYGAIGNKVYTKSEEFQNKNTNLPLKVTLDFMFEKAHYKIIKTLSNTEFYKNGRDISEITKTGTENKILNIIKLTKDEFFNFTYLAQNANNFLSKTPSEKFNVIKDIIYQEELQSIKNKLNNIISDLKQDKSELEIELAKIRGNIYGLESSLLNSNIKLWDKNTYDRKTKECEDLKQSLKERVNLQRNYDNIRNDTLNIIKELKDIKEDYNTAKNRICPLCKQVLQNDNLKIELRDKAITLKEKGEQHKEKLKEIQAKLQKYGSSVEESMDILKELKQEIQKQDNFIDTSNIPKEIKQLKNKQKELDIELNKTNNNIGIVTKIQKYFNTTFIQNLQQAFIKEIEQYLNLYCYDVFSANYTIDCNNSFNLYIGDKPYSYFSGGERQRIDLLLTFAIKVAISNLTNKSTNLIVFDESLSGSDADAYYKSTEILENLASSAEIKTISISHREDNSIKNIILQREKDFTKLIINGG